MSDYLTNLAQRVIKPTAVRPRLRSFYADSRSEPVQEIFEESEIDPASPVNRVAVGRPPLATEPPLQPPAPREDRTQNTPSEPAIISRTDHGSDDGRFVPRRTEVEPPRETLLAPDTAPVAGIDVGPQTSSLDAQAAISASRQEPVLRPDVAPGRTTVAPAPGLDEHEEKQDHHGEPPTAEAGFPTGDAKRPPPPHSPQATTRRQDDSLSDRSRVLSPDVAFASETPAPADPPTMQAARALGSRADSATDGEHESVATSIHAPEPQQGLSLRPGAHRSNLRRPESRHDAPAEQEMTIEISIGRIDIRAAAAPEPAKRRSADTNPGKSSLDLYLEKQRAGGRA